jgi:hypothetical protein
LCEFHLVGGQWSHSEYTLELLEELLQKFYESKSALRSQQSTNARNIRFKNLCDQKYKEAEELWWTEARIDKEYVKLRTEIYNI